MTNKELIL